MIALCDRPVDRKDLLGKERWPPMRYLLIRAGQRQTHLSQLRENRIVHIEVRCVGHTGERSWSDLEARKTSITSHTGKAKEPTPNAGGVTLGVEFFRVPIHKLARSQRNFAARIDQSGEASTVFSATPQD